MKLRPRKPEESIKVPVWIITFSDMTTLLLTFFVLLLSMGHVRDESLFDLGEGLTFSVLQSIKGGFGFKEGVRDQNLKIKYHVDNPEQPKGRCIDPREERMRRIFADLRKSMNTQRSETPKGGADYSVMNMGFAPGQAVLDEKAKHSLTQLCFDIEQNLDPRTDTLCVVGLVGDESTKQQQWILSATRAQAAADFMQHSLVKRTETPAGFNSDNIPNWRVYWWGAGPGGKWAGQDPPRPGQSRILITVLKSKDNG